MSTGGYSRRHTRSSGSKDFSINSNTRPTPPPTTLTPENTDAEFEPCAATASFLLYAQRNVILVLHHDTLAIERRFDLHREDVSWIVTDNASERGSGRLAVSYDTGNTAIVWDILNGGEVARFSAYEHIKTASFMRNGNIAFGNDQGNIILFEPSTSEHIAARTIFDPITALAPSSDCRTFAIGYLNGSILIATLQPSFTILHTLTTSRAPSRITGLAWHGSSSKQKTDMLATQTADGDLRVWSVPKGPSQDSPNIIRVLQRADVPPQGPCWFAWSKNGRIVQYAEGYVAVDANGKQNGTDVLTRSETRAWDVRTKKVSWDIIPTVDGVTGIAAFGPSATLFTLSRNHFVQQYDITPNATPLQVASVQHPPSNTPPTPPTLLEERGSSVSMDPATFTDTAGESSADEGGAAMSPLNKIAREMDTLDALESELRDKVMPLSPTSSRGSSVSSRSSGARRRGRKYLYDRPDSSRASSTSDYEGTEFSIGTPSFRPGHESISIRSVSSFASASNARYRPTNLRKEIMRSPDEAQQTATMNLFPYTTKRLRDVPFRTPHYGNVARTPELLQREMLSVIFGWHDTARALVRNELSRHKPGSASGVILSKWLGDVGADDMASMVGSESMSSSDWMLLALSAIGSESQKKVGEAFVQRLLEKGDIHPAAAILLGLGENNDAIEVYVSQQYWLEAVILTCLTCPADWGRISYLIRKWGETEVQRGQAELAVRCFSCTSVETSEPWFSPRAQDAVYAAQQERLTGPLSAGGMTSPPISPPSRSGSGKLSQKNASLKLITTFGPKGAPVEADLNDPTPLPGTGITPIAQSALSPSAAGESWQSKSRKLRDPSSARTATPGGFGRRKRLPSRSDIERAAQEAANMATPVTAARDVAPPIANASNRRTSSVGSMHEPTTAMKGRLTPVVPDDGHLPSPAQGLFTRLRAESARRNASRERKPDGLAVQVMETRYAGGGNSPAPSTEASVRSMRTGASRGGIEQPPLTGESAKSAKARAIDDYISSVEVARDQAQEKRAQSRHRAESRKRGDSRTGRAVSRPREPSSARSDKYIQPAKRSPSSPVPMSPAEIAKAQGTKFEPATTDDESFYKIASPVESHKSTRSFRSEGKGDKRRPSLGQYGEVVTAPRARSSARSRQRSPDSRLAVEDNRGRGQLRAPGSSARSPSSPLPMPADGAAYVDVDETNSDGRRIRSRTSSRADETIQGRRAESRNERARSSSRRAVAGDEVMDLPAVSMLKGSAANSSLTGSTLSSASESYPSRARGLTRKELAAKELEERRLSLARRPSAPAIPLPADLPSGGSVRPTIGQRSHTELGNSPTSTLPPLSRSQTVDPDAMTRYGRITGMSTPSAPIGLPATPRAMRHPKYMTADPDRDDAPPVPEIPDNASQLSSLGSSLSQVTGSALGSVVGSNLDSNVGSNLTSNLTSNMSSDLSKVKGAEADDSVAPLLPATVFGQKPQARSASAPPEKGSAGVHPMYKSTLPHSNRRVSHVRKISPPDPVQAAPNPGAVSSIDETLAAVNDQQIVFIAEDLEAPPMLPELQHLAGPPPPPPPPTMYAQQSGGQSNGSGVINVGADDSAPPSAVEIPSMLPQTTYPYAMDRAATVSPPTHRRGRGSVSETIGSRFRGFGDRMRSTSRNRTKSPQQDGNYRPYETVLPPLPSHHRQESMSRAKSPYELAMAQQSNASMDQIPPPPPPPPAAPPVPGYETKLQETTIPPSSLPVTTRRSQSATGYRNPKEIRANMPPETLQSGVYQGGFL